MTNTPESTSDELVLAAIQRAAHHRARTTAAVPVWAICAHLDIPRRSGAARRLRIRLDVLHAAGLIALSRPHGIQAWALTRDGTRHLQRERRAGRVPELPESPQHRAWRDARTAANQHINRFRDELKNELQAALTQLDSNPDSDRLYQLAEHLDHNARRLASATYCAREWAEPGDAHPDIDSYGNPTDQGHDPAEQQRRRTRRHGRRNLGLWTPHP